MNKDSFFFKSQKELSSAFFQVLLRLLFLGEDAKEAVDARRLHHQLLPMKVTNKIKCP